MNITKIVIQSESGYCPVEYIYKDTLTIQPNSLQYHYKPYLESDSNPERKWKYTTNSPIYAYLYNQICELTGSVIEYEEEIMVHDVGKTKIIVTFEDGHKESNWFTRSNDTVNHYFRLIKKIIPDTEYMPIVLANEEDEE